MSPHQLFHGWEIQQTYIPPLIWTNTTVLQYIAHKHPLPQPAFNDQTFCNIFPSIAIHQTYLASR